MKTFKALLLLVVFTLLQCTSSSDSSSGRIKFRISFTKEMSDQAQDGRLLLLLANNNKQEPRFQIGDGLQTQLVFGMDVEGMKPGDEIIVDETAFGFPVQNIKDIPPGDYYAQALINRYETFNLKSGKTVKLPPDQGEGQHWNEKPGNFYSQPIKVTVSESADVDMKLVMNIKIPPIP